MKTILQYSLQSYKCPAFAFYLIKLGRYEDPPDLDLHTDYFE